MNRNRSGFSLIVVVGSLLVAGAAVTFATVNTLPGKRTVTKKATVSIPAAAAVLPALGLSPEALAAAGVSAVVAGEMRASLQAHLTSHWQELLAARAELDAAQDGYNSIAGRLASTGGGSESLTAATARLTSAQGQWQAVRDAARSAALGELAGNSLGTLNQIFANRHHDVPMKYLVVARTDQQWLDLKQALKAVAYNTARGESNPAGLTEIIGNADADSSTVAAAGRLAENLATIQQAIQQ